MSKAVLIGGLSGSGKSTSLGILPDYNIIGLDPKETFVIKCYNKDLPFRGSNKVYIPVEVTKKGNDLIYVKGNTYSSTDGKKIGNMMSIIDKQCPHIKNVIIDDWQYIMGIEFMDRADEKGYEKFTDIGAHGFIPLRKAETLRDDLYVFIMCHVEVEERLGKEYVRIKTIGKMLQEKITPEGLFTVVVEATKLVENKNKEIDVKHVFRTRSIYKDDIVKTPIGMFQDLYIPNDLGLLKKTMIDYYNG